MQSHPLRKARFGQYGTAGLISYAGVTGRRGLLSHAQNAVR